MKRKLWRLAIYLALVQLGAWIIVKSGEDGFLLDLIVVFVAKFLWEQAKKEVENDRKSSGSASGKR